MCAAFQSSEIEDRATRAYPLDNTLQTLLIYGKILIRINPRYNPQNETMIVIWKSIDMLL